MKIIRNPIEIEKEIKRRKDLYEKAHEGCYICPFCGKGESDPEKLHYMHCEKGIHYYWTKLIWTQKLFKGHYMNIDQYKCNNCKAEWESDPYDKVEDI